jgi:hypothetical protein
VIVDGRRVIENNRGAASRSAGVPASVANLDDMRSARLGTTIVVLVALLLLAGCGQSDDRATVRRVTERFLTAYDAKQGAVACSVLGSDTRKSLESEKSKPCADAVGSLNVSGGPVRQVTVALTSAKVDLASGESFFLSEESSGWRISALGCRSSTSPTSMPFDCELQA